MAAAVRKFEYNGMLLDDPNPDFSTEQVKNFYSTLYPALTNSAIKGPAPELDGSEKYVLVTNIGSKG